MDFPTESENLTDWTPFLSQAEKLNNAGYQQLWRDKYDTEPANHSRASWALGQNRDAKPSMANKDTQLQIRDNIYIHIYIHIYIYILPHAMRCNMFVVLGTCRRAPSKPTLGAALRGCGCHGSKDG